MTHVAAHARAVQRSENAVTHFVAELVVFAIGATCLAFAVGANQRWLDRHFLPSFLSSHSTFTLIETAVRVGLALVGAWLVTSARRGAGRVARREPMLTLSIAAAIALAFGAGELALKSRTLQPAEWWFADEEPRRL